MITYIGDRPFKTFLGDVHFDSEKSLDINLDVQLENALVTSFPEKYQLVNPFEKAKEETPKEGQSLADLLIDATKDMSFDEIIDLLQTEEYSFLGLKIAKTIKTKDGLLKSIVNQLSQI